MTKGSLGLTVRALMSATCLWIALNLKGHTCVAQPQVLHLRQSQSLFTRFRSMSSVFVNGHKIWMMAYARPALEWRNLERKVHPRYPFKHSRKRTLDGMVLPRYDQHVIVVPQAASMLIFDAHRWEVTEYGTEDYRMLSKGSIAVDLVRPAMDRGGEAPHWEITRLRQAFSHEFRRLRREKVKDQIYGIARMPEEWARREYDAAFFEAHLSFLVGIQSSLFPLGVLSCDLNQLSRCYLTRLCQLEGAKIQGVKAGLAVVASERTVLIGQADKALIRRFSWNSCLDVQAGGDIRLDPKWKRLASLFVDPQRRLWVTSHLPDDYYNANVAWFPYSDYALSP